MNSLNIAVLLGGASPERNVSMATGKGIALALREAGHNVRVYDTALGENAEIGLDDLQLPTESAPSPEELARLDHRAVIATVNALPDETDIAFLALHGDDGEDGKVQALLELRGLPYTGSGILASALAMDKAKSKELFSLDDISTPRYWLIRPDDDISHERLARLADEVTGYPVVVKPNDGGSTVGLTIVDEAAGLVPAVERARAYSRQVLCEEFIPGRELTVAVIGDEPMPVLEIRPKEGIYDYTNKYTAGRTEYFCPAEIPDSIALEIQTLALRAHNRLGCSGYSRVDFRLSDEGEPYCLEVNTLPGMTATSLVPKMAAAAGISFVEVCERIIGEGMGRFRGVRQTADRF